MDKHTRNTNKKIFKVNFTTKAYCNGIYSFMNGHLTVPAESKEEAILEQISRARSRTMETAMKILSMHPITT